MTFLVNGIIENVGTGDLHSSWRGGGQKWLKGSREIGFGNWHNGI